MISLEIIMYEFLLRSKHDCRRFNLFLQPIYLAPSNITQRVGHIGSFVHYGVLLLSSPDVGVVLLTLIVQID